MVKLRPQLLLALLALWTLVLVGQSVYLMLVRHDYYTHESQRISRRQADIYPLRGEIVSTDGETLYAWSTHHYALASKAQLNDEEKARLFIFLSELFEQEVHDIDEQNIFSLKIDDTNLRDVLEFVRVNPDFEVRSILSRHYNEDMAPGMRKLVGEAVTIGNKQSGVSGWEREFDEQLSGKPGTYEVWLTPSGNYIESSWKLLAPAQAATQLEVEAPDSPENGVGGEQSSQQVVVLEAGNI